MSGAPMRGSLMRFGKTFRLILVHFVVNAVALGAGYYWLGLSDSRGSTLAWSALLALLLLLTGCAAYGASLAYFGMGQSKTVGRAWKSALRNVLPLAAAAVGIAVLYWLLSLWQDFSKEPAFQLASFLTLTLRKPVKPESVLKAFDAVLFLIRWVALPVPLLPMLAAIALDGWSGFAPVRSSGKPRRGGKNWWYWLAAPLLLLAALLAPFAILDWKPKMANFSMEMVSFSLRAAAAYLLFAGGWLLLAFATCAGRPSFTQPSTAVSP